MKFQLIKGTSDTPKPRRRDKYRKRWRLAQTEAKWAQFKEQNNSVDADFMRLVAKIKSLYLTRGEEYFEKDFRNDTTYNLCTMHEFVTKTVYLELTVEYATIKAYVAYDFQGCPFEDAIRKHLTTYPLNFSSKYEPRRNGVATYFKGIKAYQGEIHFFRHQ